MSGREPVTCALLIYRICGDETADAPANRRTEVLLMPNRRAMADLLKPAA
jgi:hypothetical protein